MRHFRSIALAGVLALVAVACGDDDATTTTGAGSPTTTAASTTTTAPTDTTSSSTASGVDIGPMVRFGSGDHPFAIEFPEDWENERDSFGAVIIFFSPLTGDGDQFSENVNVVVEDLAGADLTLDEYVELAVSQLVDFIPDIDIYDEFDDEMDTQPSRVIAYTGSQEGVTYNWVQEIALFEGSAYIITYTGEDDFETYLPHAAEIFESFDFRE